MNANDAQAVRYHQDFFIVKSVSIVNSSFIGYVFGEITIVRKGVLLMVIQPGQKLGNYSVLRIIGQGGFADVYLGQHVYLHTQAAIKVLQAHMAQDDFVSFQAEAKTIANLTHPHIVRVLEFGKEEDLPFLVMEYCPHGTLRERHLRGTRISLAECVGYVKQVAAALHYAHGLKVIHRDIKPENMLVSKDGSILLSDFGIALVAQSSRYQSRQDMVGTLAYMAPEQFDGKVTFASDQYALGVVVYEWLCGEMPFQGSPMEIIAQRFKGQIPSLQAKVPGLPVAVELVLRKALASDPRQRFGSIQAFAEALEQASQGKMPAGLDMRYDTGSISATLRKDAHSFSTTIPPNSPGATIPAGQHSDTSSASSVSTGFQQPVFAVPSYPALPYSQPSGTMRPLPYGQTYPIHQPPKKSNTGCFVAVIIVLVLALLGTSMLAVSNIGANFNASETATVTTGSSGATAQAAKATKSRELAKDGTFSKNIRLSCGGCNDPLVVTIKTITVESATGRMAWNATIYNNSADTYSSSYYYFTGFSLQAATDTNKVQASGQYMQMYGEDTIPPEQQAATKFIFSFIPYKNEPYTLYVKLYAYPAGEITFTPVSVTFS
jgi:serine/threonine protein kinase